MAGKNTLFHQRALENDSILKYEQLGCALGRMSRSEEELQLDWSSCAATLKINSPRDQEGYDWFEYKDEKLLTRRIQRCTAPSSIFWGIFEQ